MSTFSVCVYCGSRMGDNPAYEAAAREVGKQIGERGWQLVYGGGSTGLMGAVADATLAHGGRVIGVIPERLMQREMGHKGVSELHVVGNMHERKQMMATHADAFLAIPGGIGTMEEIFEVWTWRQLGYHHKSLGLLNTAGYYDELLRFIDRSRESGFLWPDVQQLLLVDNDVTALLTRLHNDAVALQKETPPDAATASPGGLTSDI